MVLDRRAVSRPGEPDRRKLPRFDLGRLNYQTISAVLKDPRAWETLPTMERLAMSCAASAIANELKRRDNAEVRRASEPSEQSEQSVLKLRDLP